MADLRLTELHLPPATTPSLKELIDCESTGRYAIPIDTMTDCFDLFELVTESKDIPQDKSQMLIVISLRERLRMLRTRCYMGEHKCYAGIFAHENNERRPTASDNPCKWNPPDRWTCDNQMVGEGAYFG